MTLEKRNLEIAVLYKDNTWESFSINSDLPDVELANDQVLYDLIESQIEETKKSNVVLAALLGVFDE